MSKFSQAVLWLSLFNLALQGVAAPFYINSGSELRSDAVVDWSDFSMVHDTVIPDLHSFTPLDDGTPVKPWASDDSPVYFGFIDPEARLGVFGFRSSNGNNFLISNIDFQLPVPTTVDPATLPVTNTVTLSVSNTATYLHEGLNARSETVDTATASEDNDNAYDLNVLLPGLRTGDFIHFERLGYSRLTGVKQNNLLGLFTHTEEIAGSSEFRRVETALEAGTDFYTPPFSNDSLEKPTNLSQDFKIGTSSFVPVPNRARYLLFSLAQPSPSASPLQVRVSHIEHDAFNQWVAAQGSTAQMPIPMPT